MYTDFGKTKKINSGVNMAEKIERSEDVCCGHKKFPHHGKAGGGIYGLAFIGALIYFLQNAETFWMGVLGVLKAMVWPAILVYEILKYLKI